MVASKYYMKKNIEKNLIIALDILLFPLIILCRYLSQFMLTLDTSCFIASFGGKCISCGGTHFVKDLTSGNIVEAFYDNQYFFICTVYILLSLVLLNLHLLFRVKIAEKMLCGMYSMTALICFLTGMASFFVIRNISIFLN